MKTNEQMKNTDNMKGWLSVVEDWWNNMRYCDCDVALECADKQRQSRKTS
jgi:hypothetical protein